LAFALHSRLMGAYLLQAHFACIFTCFFTKNHKKRHKLPEYQRFYKVFNDKIAGNLTCQKNYMVKYHSFKPKSLFRLFRLFLFHFVEQDTSLYGPPGIKLNQGAIFT